MEAKAPNPATLLEGTGASPLIEAAFGINHLKQLYRRGWLALGVPPERCESVAEHSFGTAVLALLLSQDRTDGLDANRMIHMALLHDFGEIHAGDTTPADGIAPEEKRDREHRSVEEVLSKLPGGAGLLALWEEYERGETPEARFVRQLDRLEMALQAAVYEKQGPADLGEFFATAAEDVSQPELKALLTELENLR